MPHSNIAKYHKQKNGELWDFVDSKFPDKSSVPARFC